MLLEYKRRGSAAPTGSCGSLTSDNSRSRNRSGIQPRALRAGDRTPRRHAKRNRAERGILQGQCEPGEKPALGDTKIGTALS